MRVIPILLLIAFAVPIAPYAASVTPINPLPSDTVPCIDPRGCPDMMSDTRTMHPALQTRTWSASSCEVQEGTSQPGTRTLLRFTSTWANNGSGALVVGDPSDHPEWFYFAPCHGHYHFKTYADYRLWTPSEFATWDAYRNSNPGVSSDDALNATGLSPLTTRKGGFCVIDIRNEGGLVPLFQSCSMQGVTPGWADEYSSGLSGQYVDVTGMPHGTYVLEEEANAHRLFQESNYDNNRGFMTVTI